LGSEVISISRGLSYLSYPFSPKVSGAKTAGIEFFLGGIFGGFSITKAYISRIHTAYFRYLKCLVIQSGPHQPITLLIWGSVGRIFGVFSIEKITLAVQIELFFVCSFLVKGGVVFDTLIRNSK